MITFRYFLGLFFCVSFSAWAELPSGSIGCVYDSEMEAYAIYDTDAKNAAEFVLRNGKELPIVTGYVIPTYRRCQEIIRTRIVTHTSEKSFWAYGSQPKQYSPDAFFCLPYKRGYNIFQSLGGSGYNRFGTPVASENYFASFRACVQALDAVRTTERLDHAGLLCLVRAPKGIGIYDLWLGDFVKRGRSFKTTRGCGQTVLGAEMYPCFPSIDGGEYQIENGKVVFASYFRRYWREKQIFYGPLYRSKESCHRDRQNDLPPQSLRDKLGE